MHNKEVLTPQYYEKIKEIWPRLSDIPLKTLKHLRMESIVIKQTTFKLEDIQIRWTGDSANEMD